MNALEQHLVERLHTDISRLWAVADADGLYRSDVVNRLLAEKGIEIVLYEEPIAFRFFYETTIRPKINAGETAYAVLFDPGNEGFRCLPADIYEQSQHLEISLGDLFPKLSRKVLKDVEPSILSRVWERSDAMPSQPAGERESSDLVLRLGYRIETSLIESFSDVVRMLLDLHLNKQALPNHLVLRLSEVAHKACGNILDFIRKPALFQTFLQSEWQEFIHGSDRAKNSSQGAVDFSDPRIRVYVDGLFQQGFLLPVEEGGVAMPEWAATGIIHKYSPRVRDLKAQRDRVASLIPKGESSYRDWLNFASCYAQLVAECFKQDTPPEELSHFWSEVWEPVDLSFSKWSATHLDTLHNLPPTRPVVLHHIPRFLSRRVRPETKVALFVLDGLALCQWEIVKECLRSHIEDIRFNEDACFAIIPSITNVCRQSLFAGESPAFLTNSLHRTDSDESRWKAFWGSGPIKSTSCIALNIQGSDTDLPKLQAACSAGNQIVGITVRMPDEIMHGSKLGWIGMGQQIALWASQSFLSEAISQCLREGYEVFLTADHGNLESIGSGSFSEGALVDRSGERVRIYTDPTIRDRALQDLAGRGILPVTKQLPGEFLPIVHSGRGAFIPSGQVRVCHGGLSLDEMVVPFVEITKG